MVIFAKCICDSFYNALPLHDDSLSHRFFLNTFYSFFFTLTRFSSFYAFYSALHDLFIYLHDFLTALSLAFTRYFHTFYFFLSPNRGSQQIFKEQFYYYCDVDKGKLCFRIGVKMALFICLIKLYQVLNIQNFI